MTVEGIKAAVFRDGVEEAVIEHVHVTELRDHEVLVKLVATGICHTDLTCRDGMLRLPRPAILGHEGAGRVAEIGAKVTGVKVGDPVVLTFLSCGECAKCRAGVPAYCELFLAGNFTCRRLDGSTAMAGDQGDVSSHFFGQSSFATYSVSHERNVIKVREDAPLELLGPLGCGVQTGAGSVINVLRAKSGESLVVFGGGGVGLSGVMAAKVLGCGPIIVVEPNAGRRALALEVGADHALDPAAEPKLVERLQELAGRGLDNALDTTGIPSVIMQAIDCLGGEGRVALVTLNALDATLQVPIMSLLGRGISISGVNMGDSVPKEFIPYLVDLIVEGKFPLDKIVKYYNFSDINRALSDQESGKTVKPILRITD